MIFAFGSVAVGAGHESSPSNLIMTRALMGIGHALIMPSTLSILTNVFRDPQGARPTPDRHLGRLLRPRG